VRVCTTDQLTGDLEIDGSHVVGPTRGEAERMYIRDRPQSTVSALRLTSSRFPDQAAVIDANRTVTYGEVADEVDRAAASMLRQGIGQGSFVAIWAPNSWRWIVVALAAQACGAAVVPVNTRFTSREVEHVLRVASANVLFTTRHFLDQDRVEGALALRPQLPSLSLIVAVDEDDGPFGWQAFQRNGTSIRELRAVEEAVNSQTICEVLFTSGTTGLPKGAKFDHGQVLGTVSVLAELLQLTHEDKCLVIPPFFHVFGSRCGWLVSVLVGATILPVAVFDADETLRTVARERVTVLPGPPTVFSSMLASPQWGRHDISSLRATLTGSTIIPPQLVRDLWDKFTFQIVLNGYGLTECCGLATSTVPGDSLEDIAGGSGRPIPGVEVVVVNEAGQHVEPTVDGEVWIRGFNVMKQHVGEPGDSGAVDSQGWLHTGDIGHLSREGRLTITARIKDMFIVGGFNVYPAEVEHVVADHPAVAEVAVVGIPDDRMGEVGAAFIVCKQGEELDSDEFRQWCRERLANYKVPRFVLTVPTLPQNAIGKVVKDALRDMAREQAL
jgi:HIP---CoA ligase